MIYRLNLFLDGKLASTELIEADRIEGAKRIAREALDKGQAHAADLVTMAGRLIYRRPRRAPDLLKFHPD